jgi:hypothetical protein
MLPGRLIVGCCFAIESAIAGASRHSAHVHEELYTLLISPMKDARDFLEFTRMRILAQRDPTWKDFALRERRMLKDDRSYSRKVS